MLYKICMKLWLSPTWLPVSKVSVLLSLCALAQDGSCGRTTSNGRMVVAQARHVSLSLRLRKNLLGSYWQIGRLTMRFPILQYNRMVAYFLVNRHRQVYPTDSNVYRCREHSKAKCPFYWGGATEKGGAFVSPKIQRRHYSDRPGMLAGNGWKQAL